MTDQTVSVAALEARLLKLGAKEMALRDRHHEAMSEAKAKAKNQEDVYWSFRIMAAVCLGKVQAYNDLRDELVQGKL